MSTATSTTLGRYLYAFVAAEDAPAIVESGFTGLEDARVVAHQAGSLAALVTEIEVKNIRPRRKLLAAHQSVVTEVSRQWRMLPVSFGVIANSASELETMLESHADELRSALERVGGKVEMSLVLSWATEDVFSHLVSINAELQRARDAIANGQATRDDMIEIGRQFDGLLSAERERHAADLRDGLAGVAHEIDVQTPKSEKEIVRLVGLIDREGEEAFSAAVHELAKRYDESYAFSFSGPWPPYSFVNLKLSFE